MTATIEISAPPEVVWEMYCDPHRYPELTDPTQRMLRVPEAPMSEGYVYVEYAGFGPFNSESEWTVTEFQPKRRQVHAGDDGTLRFGLEIDIEATGLGCRLTQRFSIEPRGAARFGFVVLWPIFMRRLARRSTMRTVASMKRAAEASL